MRSAVIDDYIIWLRWVGQRTLRDNAVCKLYLHFESSFFSAIIGWILREIEKEGNIGSNSNEYKEKKKKIKSLKLNKNFIRTGKNIIFVARDRLW